MTRSARPDVRNPLLKMPSAKDIQNLPPEARLALRNLALDCAKAWGALADELWRKRKPPMASYWRGWAVNARHLARLCK